MDKLKDQGWYLTEDGLKKLPAEVDRTDTKKILQAALDIDLREIGNGALPSDISRKEESIPGKIVLQISKIRNLSSPKPAEESKHAPRFLQIDFTDGVNQIQGIEMESIPAISLNTAPGTKVYFKNDRITLLQGIMMLKSEDIQVLGGKVQALYEKWEMNRTLLKYAKGVRSMGGPNGPPPWIPFGQKIQQNVADKNFKSLAASGDKESKENNEFDAMRNEAIAEAAKLSGKKVFGGGNQRIVDHNVKKILEKGYSEQDAKTVLKSTRNNLERALYQLKRREEFKSSLKNDDSRNNTDKTSRSVTSASSTGRGLSGKGSKKTGNSKDDSLVPTKPAANVSLFDFFTDKLPTNSSEPTSTEKPATNNVSNNNSTSTRYDSFSNSRSDRTSRSNTFDNSSSNKQSRNNNSSYHNSEIAKKSNSSTIPNSRPNANNNVFSSSSSTGKFENNISSSFQAATSNRGNRNSNRGGRNSYRGPADRNQYTNADNYNNRDIQRNNSNYNSKSNNDYRESGRSERAGSYQSSNPSQYQEHNRPSQNSNSTRGGSYDNNRISRTTNDNSHQSQNRNGGYESNRSGNSQQVTSKPGHGQSNTRYSSKESSNSYQSNQPPQHQYQQSNSSHTFSDNTRQSVNSSYHSNHQQSIGNITNDMSSNKMNKLIEETNKMKIDSTQKHHTMSQQQPAQKRNQHASQLQQNQQLPSQVLAPQQQIVTIVPHHPSHHTLPSQPPSMQQQQQPTQQQLQQQNAYAQLPNGFTYDPNKIMGFQNKETNDFAMTLLKSQGIATALVPTTTGAPPPPQLQMSHHPSQQPQPFATGPTTYVIQQTVPPTQTQAMVHQQPNANHHATVHSVQMPPPPTTFGINPGDSWNWKIGDRCLAKYWDDGRYYEAEITGISDKTCVVFYLGYGNHEEVLKTDCLPITDAQNRVINFSTPTSVTTMAPAATGVPNRGVPNRYRTERQMYVPPPKREI